MAASDEDQIEVIRDWLRENGKALLAGAVIAIAGVVGWQQWDAYQARTAEAASLAYSQLIDAQETGADPETVERRGRAVMEEYSGLVYASMAGLQLAEYHTERNALSEAGSALRWVIDNSEEEVFQHVARLRLAQVLIGDEQYEEALLVLDVPEAGAYESQYLERRGDVHAALGDHDRARQIYDRALQIADINGTRRALIQLKRNDLTGGNPV